MAKAIRHSAQRDRIYAYLTASKEHPSAEMIYSALKPELPELSLGTVYRNLKLLEQLGMIQKVTSYNGNERYDAICENHVHFICQQCGSITDIFTVDTDKMLNGISLGEGYDLSNLSLMLTGICPHCKS